MSISPVSSGTSQVYTPATSATREAAEPKVNGKEARNDGDGDDGSSKIQAPTVNTSGQMTGSRINTTA